MARKQKTANETPVVALPAPEKTIVHMRTDVSIYFGIVEDGNLIPAEPATLTLSRVNAESMAVLLEKFEEIRQGLHAQVNSP